VELRDAVDRVTPDTRQVRHAHVTFAMLIDERQTLDACFIAEESYAREVEEAALIS